MEKLFLTNAEIFDGRSFLKGNSVEIENGVITWVGSSTEARYVNSVSHEIIDCDGGLLAPGFIDSHIHLMSLAATLIGWDISCSNGKGLGAFKRSLNEARLRVDGSGWIRCYGYDEVLNAGLFNLDRWLIDEVIPDRPVKISYQSGHGHVLNSAALMCAGITEESVEPEGGFFQREHSTGQLNGVMFECEEFLDSRIPRIGPVAMNKAVAMAGDLLSSNGVTTVVDASFTNDIDRLEHMALVKRKGLLEANVVFMPGVDFVRDFYSDGLRYGTKFGEIWIGPVKIMVTYAEWGFHPCKELLSSMVYNSHANGFPVSIHCVESEVLSLVLSILGEDYLYGDRLEHVACVSEAHLNDMKARGIFVSTQPSFLHRRGDRYIKELKGMELMNLYRVGSLLSNGIPVGISSDAPVTPPNPLEILESALKRTSINGVEFTPNERVKMVDALQMMTSTNALISGLGHLKGEIKVGYDADLVLLGHDFKENVPESRVLESVLMTIISGRLVYHHLS